MPGMNSLSRHRLRPLLPLLSLPALAVSSCKTAGGTRGVDGLRPAAESRPAMIASVAIAPLDAILARVDALAHTLELPFAGKDFVTMLASQNGLPAEAISHIDT